MVETSNPAGGVTVKLPVRLLPETEKLVGLAVAVPYVVLTAAKVPLAVIVGVAAEAGAKAMPRKTVPAPAVATVEGVLLEPESVILKMRFAEASALVA